MAEIGVISARITADDREFQRAFERSRGSIRELSDRFRRAAATAAKFTAAIGAVAVAVGARLVNAQIKAIQSTNRLVNISGMQADTIEALRLQSEKYGISQQRVNDAVVDFSERLGEARSGAGEAVDGFEMLERASGRNIDLGKNVNAVWEDFITAMGQVSDESTRAAVAAQIGGDALRDILPVLSQGRADFEEAARAVRELGLSFTEIEGQQVQQAAAAMSRMQNAISGVVRQATVQLSPIITEVANSFVDAARQAGGFRDQIISGMEGSAVAIAHVQRTIKAMQIVWEGLKMSFEGVRLAIMTGLENIAKLVRSTINNQIDSINFLIEQWNRLGIAQQETIDRLEAGPLEDTFRSQSRAARESIDAIQQKMHELAMEGMDPEAVREYFQTLREEARNAAEAAGGLSVTPTRGGGDVGAGGNEEERKAMEERLEMIREHLMSEQELRNKRHETRLEQLRAFREKELLTKKEFDQLERDLEAKHQDEMLKQRQRGMKASTAMLDTQFGSQTGMMMKEFRTQLTVMSEHNKKAFQIQKAFAISDAVVSAYQGISKTLAAYPYPFNLGLAAAHAAVAFAKVQAIRSQSFGGGGAGATALPGSSAAAQPAQQGPGADAQGGGGPSREATFNIQGDNFGPDAIEQIATGLNEFMGDNGDLKVNVRRAS